MARNGGNVGNITLGLNLNTSGLNRSLGGLQGNLGSLTSGFSMVGAAAVAAFAAAAVAITKFSKEALNAFSEAEQGAMKLYATLSGQGINFNSADSFITKFVEDGLVELGKAQEAYANLAAMGMTTEQIETMMQVMKDSASVGRQAGKTIGEAMASATEGMKQGLSNKTDNVGITTNLSKMEEEYKKLYGIVGDLTQEQKNQAYVNGFLKEGAKYTGTAAKMTQTYSGSVSALSTQFNNLKVNMGSIISHVVTPIIQGLTTIISKINQMVKTWADALNGMFHTKTPKDFFTDNSSQITDAVVDGTQAMGEGAAGAAKKILRAVAPFDKLNKLTDNSASGSGGGSTTSATTTTLELDTTETESKLDGLNSKISNLKDNLVNSWNLSGFGMFVNNIISGLQNLCFNNVVPLIATIKDSFSEWWGIIKEGWELYIAPVFKKVKDNFNNVLENLKPGMNILIRIIGKIIDITTVAWKELFSPLVSWILKNLMPVIGFIMELFNNLAHILGLTLTLAFTACMVAIEKFVDYFRGLIDKIIDVKNTFLDLKDGIIEAFKAIPNAVKTAINYVIDLINGMINTINKINIEIPNPFGEPTQVGFNIPNIPMLANGGYVGPNSPQLAVIGDNRHYGEVVANDKQLSDLGNTIINGVVNALGNISGNNPIYLTVNVGEEEITDIVVSNISRNQKRTGKRIL